MTDLKSQTEVLTSRFAHDLANPLGAIGNGLELLELTGVPMSEEMRLIHDSLTNATSRLKVFRTAFGAAGNDSHDMQPALETWNSIARLRAMSNVQAVMAVDMKLIYLSLYCFESTMPFGGEVSIEQTGATLSLHCTARRVDHITPLWDHVTAPGGEVEQDPSKFHFHSLGQAIYAFGRTAHPQFSADGLTLEIRA